MADICGETYARPAQFGNGSVICTFIKGHSARHSWETLRIQDDTDLAATVDEYEDVPSDVAAILTNITEGRADPYLEAILAVTHNRKRALRGVRGFPRRDRNIDG